jgi:hypothetical protein
MLKEIKFTIIELEPNTFHPLVKADFKGPQNYWWVIDSGASKSVMEITLMDHYLREETDAVMATGLGKEEVSTSSGIIEDLKLDSLSFGPLKVALVDFKHINTEYSKFSDKKIIGLIGCDFLYAHKAVIDFKLCRVILW